MDGFELWERNVSKLTFSGLTVATNDYVLVHFDMNDTHCRPDATLCGSGETTAVDQNPVSDCATNVDTAFDWYMTDAGLTNTDTVVTLYDPAGTIVDAVLVSDAASGTAAGASETQATTVADAGEWEMVGGGIPGTGFVDDNFNAHAVLDLNATSSARGGASIQRLDDADTNTMADWNDGNSMPNDTWGANNPRQTDF